MKIGYAKTLTGKLDSVTQETFIDQYAVEKFYVDKISSTSLDAPRLTDMLKSVREGDTVIVNAFSEVAYNVRVFLKIVEQLELKKVTFISIRENLDTSTSIGKFAVSILTELKQIEHENLLERQRIGIEQANLKPKKGAQVMRKNEKITALYERLSRDDFGKDDDQQRESNSISNQKAMLEEFAARQGFTNIVHFTDDGISGTCFDEVR